MVKDDLKTEILESLSAINLHKVIMFGSYANGTPGADSDIDLLVVTDDDFMPKDYKENMSNYLRVSSKLRGLKKRIPIDLIVHTKPMHDTFIRLGSMFSREVMKKGEILYEKNL